MKNLYADIRTKASKNKDRQAIIRPSEYDFNKTEEGTVSCKNYLRSLSIVRSVETMGKDLLDVRLYEEE